MILFWNNFNNIFQTEAWTTTFSAEEIEVVEVAEDEGGGSSTRPRRRKTWQKVISLPQKERDDKDYQKERTDKRRQIVAKRKLDIESETGVTLVEKDQPVKVTVRQSPQEVFKEDLNFLELTARLQDAVLQEDRRAKNEALKAQLEDIRARKEAERLRLLREDEEILLLMVA